MAKRPAMQATQARLLQGSSWLRITWRVMATVSTSYRVASGPLEDVVFGAGFRFRSTSYATMRGSYVDRNARFDPSYLFDVNVSMPLSKFGGPENWTLALGVRNLFGEKYFDTARHYYECLVGEPRTFEIGIRARF